MDAKRMFLKKEGQNRVLSGSLVFSAYKQYNVTVISTSYYINQSISQSFIEFSSLSRSLRSTARPQVSLVALFSCCTILILITINLFPPSIFLIIYITDILSHLQHCALHLQTQSIQHKQHVLINNTVIWFSKGLVIFMA